MRISLRSRCDAGTHGRSVDRGDCRHRCLDPLDGKRLHDNQGKFANHTLQAGGSSSWHQRTARHRDLRHGRRTGQHSARGGLPGCPAAGRQPGDRAARGAPGRSAARHAHISSNFGGIRMFHRWGASYKSSGPIKVSPVRCCLRLRVGRASAVPEVTRPGRRRPAYRAVATSVGIARRWPSRVIIETAGLNAAMRAAPMLQ